MPVSNIAEVTETIIDRIKLGLSAFPDLITVDVFPDPMTREEKPGLSFYLYHFRENPHYRNAAAPGRDTPPVKLNPMGIDLYYQLTAYSEDAANGTAALNEQRMMTVAIKALHDSPLLTLGEDKFRIMLQPTPATEAVHNWTAGDRAMKLSAYYEVTPVLLEPEKPTINSGRVLLYGNYIFTAGLPKIIASISTLEFTLPTELTPRSIVAQPAQGLPGSTIVFEGTGFADGMVELRINNFRFTEKVITPNWNLVVAPGKLTATVSTTAHLESNLSVVNVLPGIYTAQVVVTKTVNLPGGSTKTFRQESNQFPFIVMPEAAGVLVGDMVTVTGYGYQTKTEFDNLGKELMEVYLGERKFSRNEVPIVSAGEFIVNSGTELQFKLPTGMASGPQPLRIIVAGAESSPAWINLP
jgi:hypothetical protein